MKVCIVGDIHFSSTSSIVRGRGKVFTERLENCINSIQYVEQFAENYGCDYIVYLGDFFDKETLSSEELTALQSIEWSSVKKIFLVGNHEMGTADLSKSSAHIFNLIPNSTVIDSPNGMVGFGYRFMFLPYILESERKTVREYFNELFCSSYTFETQEVKNTYIFSHNDIKGVQMGNFISTEGFDIEDIEHNCYKCFNGHLHNEGYIGNKIMNVGNLTGQNFSEDASRYKHKFCILDTSDGGIVEFLNPFAYYFQKVEIKNESDFELLRGMCFGKYNLVLSVKCINKLTSDVRQFLEQCEKVVTFRMISVVENEAEVEDTIQELTDTDYIEQFTNFVTSVLGVNDIVKSELLRISR